MLTRLSVQVEAYWNLLRLVVLPLPALCGAATVLLSFSLFSLRFSTPSWDSFWRAVAQWTSHFASPTSSLHCHPQEKHARPSSAPSAPSARVWGASSSEQQPREYDRMIVTSWAVIAVLASTTDHCYSLTLHPWRAAQTRLCPRSASQPLRLINSQDCSVDLQQQQQQHLTHRRLLWAQSWKEHRRRIPFLDNATFNIFPFSLLATPSIHIPSLWRDIILLPISRVHHHQNYRQHHHHSTTPRFFLLAFKIIRLHFCALHKPHFHIKSSSPVPLARCSNCLDRWSSLSSRRAASSTTTSTGCTTRQPYSFWSDSVWWSLVSYTSFWFDILSGDMCVVLHLRFYCVCFILFFAPIPRDSSQCFVSVRLSVSGWRIFMDAMFGEECTHCTFLTANRCTS